MRWDPAPVEIAEYFNRYDQRQSRGGFVVHYIDPCWWTNGEGSPPGAARCARFDAALRKDVEDDPFVKACLKTGLDPADLDDAVAALSALRRIEELDEQGPWAGEEVLDGAPLSQEELDRLAFEALPGLEALERVAPLHVLPKRARLRQAMFSAPLGERLAALDLARARRVVGTVEQFDAYDDWSRYAFVCAETAVKGREETRAFVAPLVELGHFWAHECALIEIFLFPNPGYTSPEEHLKRLMEARLQDLDIPKGYLHSLKPAVGDKEIQEIFAPTVEDRMRCRQPYKFKPPSFRTKETR
jgi:hypothetical protein